MNSEQIQEMIYTWARGRKFTAPYGVLESEQVNRNGKKCRTVTFGYARTLDVTVSIYNRNFITVRTSAGGGGAYKNLDAAMEFLETL